ncbi:MAG: SPOR domain-containing protein [Mariprofundaceae bacterium]
MSKKLRGWVATPNETKTAWIIASACIVLVVVSFLWPQIGSDYIEEITSTPKQKIKPENESIEKIIVKVQKQENRTVTKSPQPAPALKKPVPVIAEKAKQTSKPAPKPATASKTLSKGYYVQVGAFKEHKRALVLQKKMASHWNIQLREKANKMVAVWAGPYKSSKEATRIKAEITTRTKIKGFIVKN